MKLKIFFITGLLFILTGCAINTSYDFDKTVDFSQYKTFSIYEDGINKLKVNDLDRNRITRAIIQQLNAKGLTESPNGDLKVNVMASSQKVINIDNNPYWAGPWGWGYGWSRTSTVYETRVGKLTVHLVDAKKNILVWEGIADGFNVNNVSNKEEQINKAIQKVFMHYPPSQK